MRVNSVVISPLFIAPLFYWTLGVTGSLIHLLLQYVNEPLEMKLRTCRMITNY